LKIHLKTCEKMWEVEEAKKPPGQRRPVPKPPEKFDEIIQDIAIKPMKGAGGGGFGGGGGLGGGGGFGGGGYDAMA
jgi:uncharacterized membrane protein YgcG